MIKSILKWGNYGLILLFILFSFSCYNNKVEPGGRNENDTITKSIQNAPGMEISESKLQKNSVVTEKEQKPVVLVYNFHVTNRCASCIAIEEATDKTLKTYFQNELSSGKIMHYSLNVDDDANAAIAEKYQVFGSGIFVTGKFKGKEITTDLTADGFKFARNKEEKFIAILQETISEYLNQNQ